MVASSNPTNKYILCCTCPGTPKFSEEAFKILYPNEEIPEIFSGRNNICTLADRYSGTNFGKYALSLAKLKNKFTYLFEVAENGDVITQINLKTGSKVL